MSTLRIYRNTFIGLLSTFIYDPLGEWTDRHFGESVRREMEMRMSLNQIASKIDDYKETLRSVFSKYKPLFSKFHSCFRAMQVCFDGFPAMALFAEQFSQDSISYFISFIQPHPLTTLAQSQPPDHPSFTTTPTTFSHHSHPHPAAQHIVITY
jgi:hypothetical protein